MPEEPTAAQARIIEATINCIEREGIAAVTTRKIAREAGVNSAAINYYFRSKDKLVEAALRVTLEHGIADWEETLLAGSADLRETLRSLYSDFMEGGVRFPGIMKAHLYEPLIKDNYDTEFVARFNGFVELFWKRVRNEAVTGSEREQKLKVILLFSALTLPIILPILFRRFSDLDFRDPRTRRSYTELLLELFEPQRPGEAPKRGKSSGKP